MNCDIKKFSEVMYAFGDEIRAKLEALPDDIKEKTHEIRLRAGQPVMLTFANGIAFISGSGVACGLQRVGQLIASKKDIDDCFDRVCEYSVHSCQQQISQGFVMMHGGHRAGICGTAVVSGETITSFKDIYAINIRIARQVMGSADKLIRAFARSLCPAVIGGAPGSGKTTILRDLARQLSCGALGQPLKVAVIDERGEIGAVTYGVAQNDLGPSCDIITGCPKGVGINIAVRTLSPDIILFDEIGRLQEAEAVMESMHAGVPVITTLHAGSISELKHRLELLGLLDTGCFEKLILLCGRQSPCEIAEICDLGGFVSKLAAI